MSRTWMSTSAIKTPSGMSTIRRTETEFSDNSLYFTRKVVKDSKDKGRIPVGKTGTTFRGTKALKQVDATGEYTAIAVTPNFDSMAFTGGKDGPRMVYYKDFRRYGREGGRLSFYGGGSKNAGRYSLTNSPNPINATKYQWLFRSAQSVRSSKAYKDRVSRTNQIALKNIMEGTKVIDD